MSMPLSLPDMVRLYAVCIRFFLFLLTSVYSCRFWSRTGSACRRDGPRAGGQGCARVGGARPATAILISVLLCTTLLCHAMPACTAMQCCCHECLHMNMQCNRIELLYIFLLRRRRNQVWFLTSLQALKRSLYLSRERSVSTVVVSIPIAVYK